MDRKEVVTKHSEKLICQFNSKWGQCLCKCFKLDVFPEGSPPPQLPSSYDRPSSPLPPRPKAPVQS